MAIAIGDTLGPEAINVNVASIPGEVTDSTAATAEDGEGVRRAVAMTVFEGQNLTLNNEAVKTSKYDAAILHALTRVGTDALTARDLLAIAAATTPYELSNSRELFKSVRWLTNRINKQAGFTVIKIIGDKTDNIDEIYFAIAENIDLTYTTDIEQPFSNSSCPAVTASGDIVGSIFGGIVNTSEVPPNPTDTDNPIPIYIFSDNLMYVSGEQGRAIRLVGNKLATNNLMRIHDGIATIKELEELSQKVEDGTGISFTKLPFLC